MTAPVPEPPKTIRQLREERGWSQQDLADQLGVIHSMVQKWELGQRFPHPMTRWRLAELFGIGVSEITFT